LNEFSKDPLEEDLQSRRWYAISLAAGILVSDDAFAVTIIYDIKDYSHVDAKMMEVHFHLLLPRDTSCIHSCLLACLPAFLLFDCVPS
jgi:hypothetical protein